MATDPAGSFRSSDLPPGLYDVYVERLGFRPLVVLGVMVSPDVTAALDLALQQAEPPVTRVDTTLFVEGAARASLARGSWDAGRDLVDLVDPLGRVSSLAALAAGSSGDLAIYGLPDRLGAVGLDGLPRAVATHPGSSRAAMADLGLPFTSLDHADLTAGSDVVWPGFGGALLSAISARAPRQPQVRVGADAGTGTMRGHLLAGGPLVRDTAWAMVGIDARRLEPRFVAPWPADSIAGSIEAFARDSLATDVSAYRGEVTERTDVVTGFARFDWQLTEGQRLSLHATAADLTTRDVLPGSGLPVGLGASLAARDVMASAAFGSRLSARLDFEGSLAVTRSKRDYGTARLPGTAFPAGALWAGSDPALAGSFERGETRATAAIRFRARAHAVKAGVSGSWISNDIDYDPWRAGAFAFGSAADFAAGRGSYVQATGGTSAASFSSAMAALFVEDAWSPLAGLQVLFGVRAERERWPRSGVATNTAWQTLTGIATAAPSKFPTRLNPRFAFTWAAGPGNRWLLRGDAGTYTERADPAVLAEAMSHGGRIRMRRGLGDLGAWPLAPDSTAAPVMGVVLTALHPDVEPPRTARVGLSIARVVFAGATLRIGGVYRHTDYLVRRSDLNLPAASVVADQDGRPLYGVLEQYGSLLAARPGSNRRFAAFDRVWALDPSGYSDYGAVTVALERVAERGLNVFASYTYSRTTDNVPGLAGSSPDDQLSPFAGNGPDWRDGRSDLDVPHRLAAGAQLVLGAVRLGGLVRYRSGAPFTPGYRYGVDANGDGAFGNDPAFVSDTVTGAAAVIGDWQCLKAQVGRFAERNSCRGPAVTSLDVRLAVRMFMVGRQPVEAVVDGINLITTDEGVVDEALFLVDPARTISTNATGTTVTVPLVTNPNFGRLVARRSPAATVRAGLRLAF